MFHPGMGKAPGSCWPGIGLGPGQKIEIPGSGMGLLVLGSRDNLVFAKLNLFYQEKVAKYIIKHCDFKREMTKTGKYCFPSILFHPTHFYLNTQFR